MKICVDESCDPSTITAIDAEAEIEKNGELLFIAAQWIDTEKNEVIMRVTRESTFALKTKPYLSDEELKELHRIIDGSIECEIEHEYPNVFYQLVSVVNEKLIEIGSDVRWVNPGRIILQ